MGTKAGRDSNQTGSEQDLDKTRYPSNLGAMHDLSITTSSHLTADCDIEDVLNASPSMISKNLHPRKQLSRVERREAVTFQMGTSAHA